MTRRLDSSDLAGIAPFDHYRARRLRPLAPHAQRLEVAAGSVISREGGLARQVVVIVDGEATLTRDGRTVGHAGPGSRLGADDVLGAGTHAATVVADTRLDVVVLPAPAYRWASQVLPDFIDVA